MNDIRKLRQNPLYRAAIYLHSRWIATQDKDYLDAWYETLRLLAEIRRAK